MTATATPPAPLLRYVDRVGFEVDALDLFCGYGGSSQGMHAAGVTVRGAANHNAISIETHAANFPQTEHWRADLVDHDAADYVDVRDLPRARFLWASPSCFPAETLVLTKRGLIPIAEVVVGDEAWTHMQRWRPVVDIMCRTSDTVIVSGNGNRRFEVTPNHGIWARSSIVPAEARQPDPPYPHNCDMCGEPTDRSARGQNRARRYCSKLCGGRYRDLRNGRQLTDSHRVEANDMTGEWWGTPLGINGVELPAFPAAIDWWWLGRWVGDGWATGSDVIICCGSHEADDLAERLGPTWSRQLARTGEKFVRYDIDLARWITEHFGKGAAEKHLPAWLLAMPQCDQQQFLDGYVSADGYRDPRGQVACGTVSKALAHGVRLLAANLGLSPTVTRNTPSVTGTIEGRAVNQRPLWRVIWWADPAKRPQTNTVDGRLWGKVDNVTPGRSAVDVYNITVDEDHTYVADGIVVYNCKHHSKANAQRIYEQGHQLTLDGLNDDDDFDEVAYANSERSRVSMSCVLRYADHHRPEIIIVENVVEVCFPGETIVLTKRGTVPISEVQVGDEVMTHNARWKPVTAVRSLIKDTVKVAGYGNSIIETTPEHRFYAREVAPLVTRGGKAGRHEARLLEPTWVEAQDLARPDEGSTYDRQYGGYAWATPTEFAHGWTRPPRASGLAVDDTAFWYMVGRWLGDGWLKTKRGESSVTRICCANHEADELETWLTKTDGHWTRYQHSESVQVFEHTNAPLVRWLRANFGEHADGKRLPGWLFGAEACIREAVLDGYVAADGHHADSRTQAVTVSRALAVGVKLLAQSLGWNANLTVQREAGEGFFGSRRTAYSIDWCTGGGRDKARQSDLHSWGRVRTVTPARTEVEVWDITVADDHSFIADGQVVHNCQWGPGQDGSTFRWWLTTLENLGYVVQPCFLNSMFFGVPQSRDRVYFVCSRVGNIVPDVDYRPPATCTSDTCQGARVEAVQTWKRRTKAWPLPRWGRYEQQYTYTCPTCRARVHPDVRPALDILDLSIPVTRIGDRRRPLAEKTRQRILAGLIRHGWAPVITAGAGNVFEATPGNRARRLDMPLATQPTSATHALATPPGFLFQTAHGGRSRGLDRPHPTVCASDDRWSLIVPLRRNGVARSTDEPIPTVCSSGFHHGVLVMRNNTARGNPAQMTTPAGEPLRTITTTGHQSLLIPYYGTAVAQGVDLPVPTVTTRDRCAVVTMTRTMTAADYDAIIDDCGFRMLEVDPEIRGASAFGADYILLGTKTDKVAGLGNAVTPPTAAWLTARCTDTLRGVAA